MDFTASIRFRNYDVGAVKAGVLLQDYRNGSIQLEEGCEPYRDTPANAAYSNTIKQFLYGEPFVRTLSCKAPANTPPQYPVAGY